MLGLGVRALSLLLTSLESCQCRSIRILMEYSWDVLLRSLKPDLLEILGHGPGAMAWQPRRPLLKLMLRELL